jgi:oligopeptide/dipeptide ABC transporter ATP-binding protein
MTNKNFLLQIHNLDVNFFTRHGIVHAVQEVSLNVNRGEITGLVGESGSGKSTVGLSIMQLLPEAGKIQNGEIIFNGKDLLKQSSKEIRSIRGKCISMTFQDPMTYLNPVMRVGDQITETIFRHNKIGRASAKELALELLSKVKINEPKRVANSYPHQLSGGMRQRILISIAISCNPQLIIADEPTTALDVTIQRGIIDLLLSIREKLDIAILLITHDLGVVSEICDNVYVMYAGRILEYNDVNQIILKPHHPYTKALLRSAISIDEYHSKLYSLDGSTPSLFTPSLGCVFENRCPSKSIRCLGEEPQMFIIENGWAKCWLHENKELLCVS